MAKKLAYGVGVYERGNYPCSHKIKGRYIATLEYATWRNMLQRCYRTSYRIKRPTYVGCSVDERFHDFQFFAEWCQTQVGFGEKNYHLDKDICFKGNKLYSPETCFFVPRDINMLLLKRDKSRGAHPIGVSWDKITSKFRACIKDGHKSLTLGRFSSIEAAFEAYKTAKESEIKRQANLYKDSIHPQVYEALMNYQVEITD